MAVKLIDLQLIYGIEGARSQFESLCAQLIRTEFPDAKGVRVHMGDGGVDIFTGEWDEGAGIHVFQIKFFPSGLGDDQKGQIRNSFKTCLMNRLFSTMKWTLCLPIDLSNEEIVWFNRWKEGVTKENMTSQDINCWGSTELEGLLFKAENEGLRNTFFKEEYLVQIRDMHNTLSSLLDDIVFRIGGPTRQHLDSTLVDYFKHNLVVAQKIMEATDKHLIPTIRFDVLTWSGLIPYIVSKYSDGQYQMIATTVREFDNANNKITAAWDIYRSGKYPPRDGINFNEPSEYVIGALQAISIQNQTVISFLINVLNKLNIT